VLLLTNLHQPTCIQWSMPSPEHMSAAPMTSSLEWSPGILSPTDCTIGRMTMAPTVWLIKVVPTSTRPQKMASTAHSDCPPTSELMSCSRW
jgi:hypothetical protein